MTEQENLVSVIIPTLAEAKRAQSLLRAIDCILAQEDVKAIPIVVVNGNRFDPGLLEQLKKNLSIKLYLEPISGLVNAHLVGRRLVETPYFSFLDDDDEYLPHALRTRLDVILADHNVDLVVSNGYRFDGKVRGISASNIVEAEINPFLALLENNWLTSCGGLYRTHKIDTEFFADATEYAEWTFLAFKICLTHKVAFVNNPSYIINDTEGSISKSVDYSMALTEVLERILELPLPPYVRLEVRRKYGFALHDLSNYFLEEGQRKKALFPHFQSICQPGGVRFILYTRKFFR